MHVHMYYNTQHIHTHIHVHVYIHTRAHLPCTATQSQISSSSGNDTAFLRSNPAFSDAWRRKKKQYINECRKPHHKYDCETTDKKIIADNTCTWL